MVTVAMRSTYDELKCLLPDSCRAIMRGVGIYDRAKQAIHQINKGCNMGIMQLTLLVNDISGVSEVISKKDGWQEWTTRLKTEWSTSFNELIEKLKTDRIKEYVNTNADIVFKAIDAWEFKGKLQWIVSEKPDPAREADAQMIAQMVGTMPVSKRLLDELKEYSTSDWMSAQDKKKLTDAITQFAEFEVEYQSKAVKLIGSVMMVNAIANGMSLWATKRFLAEKLRMNLASLPLVVRQKMGGILPAVQMTSEKDTKNEKSSSSKGPDDVAPDSQPDVQKLKKFKKLNLLK